MNILWLVAEWMPEFKGLNLCVSPSSERLVLPSQDVCVSVTSLGRQTSYSLLRLVLGPSVRNLGSTQRITQSCHSGNQVVIWFGSIFIFF